MRKLTGLLIAFLLLPTLVTAQITSSIATQFREYLYASRPLFPRLGTVIVITDATDSSTCNAGGGSAAALCRWNGSTYIALGGAGGGAGANTALSNLASVAVNTALLPAADAATDFGSASKQWANIYFSGSLIGGGSGVPSIEGTPGSCTASASGKLKICFSSTGNRLVSSYNAGAYSNNLLATDVLTTANMAAEQVIRVCPIIVGTDNGSVLVDADLGPQGQICEMPYAATVFEISVHADGTATPNVIVRKKGANGTTYTNLLSGALATSGSANNNFACAATGAACQNGAAKSGSITIVTAGSANVLAKGDTIGLTSGTAGGAAKRMSIFVKMNVTGP